MNCEKVAKSTLERHSKFFWIGGEENAQKLYWAAARAEKATGSMSLVNVEYLLVGKLSDDYARCKTGNLETLM